MQSLLPPLFAAFSVLPATAATISYSARQNIATGPKQLTSIAIGDSTERASPTSPRSTSMTNALPPSAHRALLVAYRVVIDCLVPLKVSVCLFAVRKMVNEAHRQNQYSAVLHDGCRGLHIYTASSTAAPCAAQDECQVALVGSKHLATTRTSNNKLYR